MNEKKIKEAELKVAGMTCVSCELALERKLKKVPGVIKVNVSHTAGTVRITANDEHLPSKEDVETAISEAGYCLAEKTQGQDSVRENMIRVRIAGMTDKNCELLMQEKLKLVEGVKYVSARYARGTAKIGFKDGVHPSWDELREAVESAGFKLRRFESERADKMNSGEPARQKWLEIGASLIIIFALYEVLKSFDVLSFVSSSTAGTATFGGILLIGLVAGMSSCLAVVGGLLLSVAAKYNESHQTQTGFQKFKPLLYFNAGRLVSYFILGGLIGVLGQSISLSPRMNGVVGISVALIMLYLAFSILKIIPKGSFPIRLPKRFSHWIANLSESQHPVAPFGLGALTFFLPCGFTQSLQFVALASGSFMGGAMTMFVFALGTLPALLGISAISSTAKGKTSRLFLRFSGALVLVLAFFNLNSGLLLVGVDAADLLPNINSTALRDSGETGIAEDPNVTEDPDGTQVINMSVSSYGYSPRSFTVVGGRSTIVRATADSDAGGCASVLTIPEFRILKYLSPGEVSTLGPFTPTQDFLLTCSMGMFRAKVKVVNNPGSKSATPAVKQSAAPNSDVSIPPNAQTVDLTWTEQGYSPRIIEVKSGTPVAVRISADAPTGGCMGTIVFPTYNQSAFVPQPGSAPAILVLDTAKTDPGDYPFTCGMGIPMGVLRIT